VHASLPLLSLAALTALANVSAAQAVNLQVRFGSAVAGALCGPWDCTPAPLTVPTGSVLQLAMGTMTGNPVFLIVALPPTQCASVPGFGGSLILQPPAIVLLFQPTSWVTNYVSGPTSGPCAIRQGVDVLPLPPTLPIGATLVLQTLAPDWPGNAFAWSFSNAVQVTIQ
jgi:hypothetical protein